MPRGGRRPNAGRKPGSVPKKTREIALEAAAKGISPADVMLEAMRLQHELAHAATEPEIKGLFLARAAQIAKDVAPYVHPRITPVEPKARQPGGDDGAESAPQYTERELARRIAFALLRAADKET
jgi:hypothetical protein